MPAPSIDTLEDQDSAAVGRPATLYARLFKRLLDVLGAAFLLVVFSPVMLISVLAVAASSGLPVLYRDRRAGRDGQPFTLWKFRSMREAIGGDGHPLPDAQRLTPAGGLMRRTSLDELPQLFCVLTGSMSVVGPRPLPQRYVSRYSPKQASRLLVRPGLTGWAQTHGRNTLDWDTRLSLDADYVAMLSRPGGFFLDLGIVAKTIGQVLLQGLTGRGISAPGHTTMPEFLGTEDTSPGPETSAQACPEDPQAPAPAAAE